MSCRATLVLHLFISILVAKAWGFRNLRRVDPELTCADNWLHWAGDMAPGAGFEFESEDVQFESSMCSRLDESYTRALIRHVVIGHSGTNWDLTVDAPFHTPGQLVAEIILDGLSLKIHTEDAEAAGLAAVEDMLDWDPADEASGQGVTIADSPYCRDWTIHTPSGRGTLYLIWYPHVTAPLPYESIHDLFVKAVSPNNHMISWLLPEQPGTNMVAVTTAFFRDNPLGISPNIITEDVLGFFSLILSYAKNAHKLVANQSPKHINSIMPRTDFSTMFNDVRHNLPNGFRNLGGSLYYVVARLACYKNVGGGVQNDDEFCTHSGSGAQPNGRMDRQVFKGNGDVPGDRVTVEQWMDSIEAYQLPDRLTRLDQTYLSQVGGRGTRREYVYGTSYAVPLIECRDLVNINTAAITVHFVPQAMKTIREYHRQHRYHP